MLKGRNWFEEEAEFHVEVLRYLEIDCTLISKLPSLTENAFVILVRHIGKKVQLSEFIILFILYYKITLPFDYWCHTVALRAHIFFGFKNIVKKRFGNLSKMQTGHS